MKSLFLTVICISTIVSTLYGQNTKEYNANNIAAIFISNVNGSVDIIGGDRTNVMVETSDYKMKNANTLHEFMYNDTLVIVMEDKNFTAEQCDSDYSFPGNIRQRNCNRNYNPDHINITVKVPHDLMVKASTINDGVIKIENVSNSITAKNINGDIRINRARKVHEAHTINGDLNIDFISQPLLSGKYYTLNGDLTLKVPKSFNAELSFKSFNGDFYSDIDNLKFKESKTEKVDSRRRFHIKADNKTYMTAGNGGVELALETFNGDAILKTFEN